MEKEDTGNCICFTKENYMVVCSLNANMLKVRVQAMGKQGEDEIFMLNIREDGFPDYLRQASFKQPKQIYDYLWRQRKNGISFRGGKIIILLKQGQLIEFQPACYKIQKSTSKVEIQHKSIVPVWDLSTKYSKSYQIEGNKVIKKNNGWVQLVNTEQFINNTRFKFRVLSYSGVYSIGFGVINQKRRNYQYSGDIEHYQSIGYWSRNGYRQGCICQNGQKTNEWNSDLFIDINQQCEILLNKIVNIVTFKNSRKSIDCKLDGMFEGKSIYIYVVMYDVGSTIQVL